MDSQGGMDIVCIQGPHGPLRIPLPDGAKPGEECTFRFGPPAQYHVVVPDGARSGDSVPFKGDDGAELTAIVPTGKRPGDKFEVALPVLLIQVPAGAKPGTEVMYEAPDRQKLCARIPEGMKPGLYFQVLVTPPGRTVLAADVTWPQDLNFNAPDPCEAGQLVCIQGPHGPLMVPLPDDVKPGQSIVFKIGPQNEDGYEVTVPEDAEPGSSVPFQGDDGETLFANVPPGVKPGETFKAGKPTVMVRVPAGAREGTELMFTVPGENKVRFTRVPRHIPEGVYFPYVLEPPRAKDEKAKKNKKPAEEEDLLTSSPVKKDAPTEEAPESEDLLTSSPVKKDAPTEE